MFLVWYWVVSLTSFQCSRNFFIDHQTLCSMILSKSSDTLKTSPDISVQVFTERFSVRWKGFQSDDQTICFMIFNKSSNILQNHQAMSDGPMTFREYCIQVHRPACRFIFPAQSLFKLCTCCIWCVSCDFRCVCYRLPQISACLAPVSPARNLVPYPNAPRPRSLRPHLVRVQPLHLSESVLHEACLSVTLASVLSRHQDWLPGIPLVAAQRCCYLRKLPPRLTTSVRSHGGPRGLQPRTVLTVMAPLRRLIVSWRIWVVLQRRCPLRRSRRTWPASADLTHTPDKPVHWHASRCHCLALSSASKRQSLLMVCPF